MDSSVTHKKVEKNRVIEFTFGSQKVQSTALANKNSGNAMLI